MRRRCLLAWGVILSGVMHAAQAHDFKAGDLRIDHPYAVPSLPGKTSGAVYFRGLRNEGTVTDRLLSASTPVASSVEIHRMQMQGEVMRMRAVSSVDIPAGATLVMKQGTVDSYHLMLVGLKAPLKDGDRFPVRLTFEKAGSHEVNVWVQTPRAAAGLEHAH